MRTDYEYPSFFDSLFCILGNIIKCAENAQKIQKGVNNYEFQSV